tara:strand:+ start:243 stop:473 length:231 start_codon:yes stop_codon:yes gene_type:complete
MYILDYMNNKQQLKETMKPIKIEYLSAFKNETFETDDMKVAIEICEAGINQQYLVYVNGNKYRAMNTFGKTINLNN